MCCNGEMYFFLGEREYIEGKVRPRNPKETVVVTEATYEIIQGESLVKDGKCEIDGDMVRFLFYADTVGTFTAVMTASVGVETVKSKFTLVVKE